ncbi:MAG TPA: cytochrome c maturation protein CcmE [Rhodobacteraceae bacterium]|nr:cytochrome c maturation protein CcmE [Paracoccaceae bacterium]
MAGLKKKRRIQMIVAGMTLMIAATALMGYAFQDGIEFFRSPTQVAEDMPSPDERFRLGGLIKEGSWVKGDTHSFVITDTNMEIPVLYTGILPDLFDEGQGTIATGQLINGEFVASEVLAKHDEEYMPAELVESLKEQGYYVEPSS